MKPLIGINLDIDAVSGAVDLDYTRGYMEAIIEAGGIPITIPPITDQRLEDMLNGLQGLVFIGGRDYSAKRYQEDQDPTCHLVNPDREDFDFRLMHRALGKEHLAILGICAGAQLLNVVLGGKLIQDIHTAHPESHVQHVRVPGEQTKHVVKIEPSSALAKIYGATTSLAVPTSHHQAVSTLGKGLKAVAYAEDGIIEAVELPNRFFTIGVQWHPERDFAGNKSLFEAFIKAAQSVPAVK